MSELASVSRPWSAESPFRLVASDIDGTLIHEDGTLSYTSDLHLKLAATGAEMHHTDKNTLHRVKRYHPSEES